MFNSIPPGLLQQMLAARASPSLQPMGGKFPMLQPFGQPGVQPGMGPPQFQPFGGQQSPQPMPQQMQPGAGLQPFPQQMQPGAGLQPFPSQPTFNPQPFEGMGGLGGFPRMMPKKGLGSGFGIGHFGVQPFVPGQSVVK
ncbi:hypothetical protein, partial [Nitrospira sp. BLG_2]|uniref:hypothetical protein n=1 Tax=Nitrospira sp. BLG_2 TaxID=3397507 RepID=UPI003B9AFEAD